MSERTAAETLAEMSSLATRVRAEAAVMRVATRRQGIAYLIAGIVIAGYLSWAYSRVARFIDADSLALQTGDIAVSRSIELVFQATGEARASAPYVVRGAETAFLAAIPELSRLLDVALRDNVKDAVRETLVPSDKALVEEIAKLPDGRHRIAALAANPGEAARLFGEVRAKVLGNPGVVAAKQESPPQFTSLRDHMRRLADNTGLTASEQAQRRFLQVVLSNTPLVPKP